MSNRFHNKYHRHNHHTRAIQDIRFPDANHDPIASYESPFLGDFILNGMLSATDGVISIQGLSSLNTSVFTSEVSTNPAVVINGDLTVNGQTLATDNITLLGTISANKIDLNNPYIATTTSMSAVSATGDFLILSVNGIYRAIRLWDFSPNLQDIIISGQEITTEPPSIDPEFDPGEE